VFLVRYLVKLHLSLPYLVIKCKKTTKLLTRFLAHVRLRLMTRRLLLCLFPIVLLLWGRATAQLSTPVPPEVRSPLPGQALQGRVPVLVRGLPPDYETVELAFSYSSDPTGTWFLMAEFERPVPSEKIYEWDTTTLSDGNYTLRLAVTRRSAAQVIVIVPGLRVRNYTPIETPTPTLSPTPSLTPKPGLTRTATVIVTPTIYYTPTITPVPPSATPLPTNPAQLSFEDITINLRQGALGVAACFAVVGVYASLRLRSRRR
jgi:hypothetical protein